MATDTAAQGRRTWRIGRAAAGALGLIFALFYLFEGRNLDLGRMGAPGPGIFPLIVGVILALVSVGVIADAFLSKRGGSASLPEGHNLKRLAIIFGAFLVYVGVINVVGFAIATVSLVTFYTRVVGKISWLKAAICGIGVTLVVWAAFVLILGVRLPTAMWG